jgi:hypothetical protein
MVKILLLLRVAEDKKFGKQLLQTEIYLGFLFRFKVAVV